MIDIKEIRKDPEGFKKAAKDKGFSVDIDKLLEIDVELRRLNGRLQELRTEKKLLEREAFDGNARIIAELREIKRYITMLKARTDLLQPQYDNFMLHVPQLPAPAVPVGKGESDNVEIRRWRPKTGELMDEIMILQENNKRLEEEVRQMKMADCMAKSHVNALRASLARVGPILSVMRENKELKDENERIREETERRGRELKQTIADRDSHSRCRQDHLVELDKANRVIRRLKQEIQELESYGYQLSKDQIHAIVDDFDVGGYAPQPS